MLTAIVGTNWGDEGKGRMVDLLSAEADAVVRYQGGNNAGHTVVNGRGKFILNLLPSGILREGCVNVMGGGMVIDLEHLCGEIDSLSSKGVSVTPDNLKISSSATICLPYHKLLDALEEDRLADRKFGSTRRGIAPVYGDKLMKKTLRFSDLLSPSTLPEKVAGLVEWKNLLISGGYGHEAVKTEDILSWLCTYGDRLLPYVCDASAWLADAAANGKNIIFEAQLGALRDIDFGIYPYTSSSSTISAYAPIGAGIPFARLDSIVGITKAYSSCVGEGPFTAELFGDEAHALREAGGEYGAATGRPRRVGGFDAVATRYGCRVQGCTAIALTKLDVLSYMEKIPVCVAYLVDGKRVTEFPAGDALTAAKPVYEYLPGFATDISGCRSYADLPEAARSYIEWIERECGVYAKYISVGAERDEIIVRD